MKLTQLANLIMLTVTAYAASSLMQPKIVPKKVPQVGTVRENSLPQVDIIKSNQEAQVGTVREASSSLSSSPSVFVGPPGGPQMAHHMVPSSSVSASSASSSSSSSSSAAAVAPLTQKQLEAFSDAGKAGDLKTIKKYWPAAALHHRDNLWLPGMRAARAKKADVFKYVWKKCADDAIRASIFTFAIHYAIEKNEAVPALIAWMDNNMGDFNANFADELYTTYRAYMTGGYNKLVVPNVNEYTKRTLAKAMLKARYPIESNIYQDVAPFMFLDWLIDMYKVVLPSIDQSKFPKKTYLTSGDYSHVFEDILAKRILKLEEVRNDEWSQVELDQVKEAIRIMSGRYRFELDHKAKTPLILRLLTPYAESMKEYYPQHPDGLRCLSIKPEDEKAKPKVPEKSQ